MNTYLRQYPEIKPLYFTVKNLLYTCKLSQLHNAGLGSYALLIMVCAFVQNEYSNTILQEALSLGRLLIDFLKLFGFEFDYYQKCVVLPQINAESKSFVFDSSYLAVIRSSCRTSFRG